MYAIPTYLPVYCLSEIIPSYSWKFHGYEQPLTEGKEQWQIRITIRIKNALELACKIRYEQTHLEKERH